jgi:arylamine N-acetyltransferase
MPHDGHKPFQLLDEKETGKMFVECNHRNRQRDLHDHRHSTRIRQHDAEGSGFSRDGQPGCHG